MKIKIDSKVVNGFLSKNRIPLTNAVKQFNGKNITIIIKEQEKPRSNDQNSYYWAVIVNMVKLAILNEWGENKSINEVHELLKTECNYIERVNHSTGEVLKDSKSTTENSTKEQELFHDLCRKFALEWFNIEIPLPKEEIEVEL
jgi:hypothetical protein